MDEKQMLMEFNLLWNNIMSNQAPGLNGYEISLVLTQAQDAVVNTICESFEQSESLISYLSPLVRQAVLEPITSTDESGESIGSRMHAVPGSKLFRLPDDAILRTYESLSIKMNGKEKIVDVVPVTQDALSRILADPFKGPSDRRALRLAFDYNVKKEDGKYSGRYSEIICKDNSTDNDYLYTVRYIAKPKPIVLVKLTNHAIDGVKDITPCELNENLQRKIIARAVEIAKSVWA